MPTDLPLDRILKALVAAEDEANRWLLRATLLETAGIPVNEQTLAVIGGASEERAEGAMGVLMERGMVDAD